MNYGDTPSGLQHSIERWGPLWSNYVTRCSFSVYLLTYSLTNLNGR